MKERPLIVTTQLIPKVLDGTKTNTRRVITHPAVPNGDIVSFQEFRDVPQSTTRWEPKQGYYALLKCNASQDFGTIYFRSPYGQVGDTLWAREQHHICCVGVDSGIEHRCYYSDGTYRVITSEQALTIRNWASNRPSIHLPRWASRITLEITNLRVERLQEIRGSDCLAEGIEPCKFKGYTESYRNNDYLVGHFATLWDSLNAKRGYPWESNPWVWVIEWPPYKKVKP